MCEARKREGMENDGKDEKMGTMGEKYGKHFGNDGTIWNNRIQGIQNYTDMFPPKMNQQKWEQNMDEFQHPRAIQIIQAGNGQVFILPLAKYMSKFWITMDYLRPGYGWGMVRCISPGITGTNSKDAVC